MAFIRQGGQSYQMPQMQGGGNLLGTGSLTGKKQFTQAGDPGGWTNIQDYLGANLGDQTNINVAKDRTQERISSGASNIAEQASNLTALPTATAYDPNAPSQAFETDDYSVFTSGLNQNNAINQLTALPTVEHEISGYAPLEQGVANVNPNNFQSIQSFIGDLAPTSPTYSTGQKAFDAMLLQGNPEFRKDFVPQMQEQYQTGYLQPLEQARTARMGEREAAMQGITGAQEDWRTGLSGFLGEQEQAIANELARQQKYYGDTKSTIEGNMSAAQQAQNDWDTTTQSLQDELGKLTLSMQVQNTPESRARREAIVQQLVDMGYLQDRRTEQDRQRGTWFGGNRPYTSEPGIWGRPGDYSGPGLDQLISPNAGTAFNYYAQNSGDATRAQDIAALYSALGMTPNYSPGSTNFRYDIL